MNYLIPDSESSLFVTHESNYRNLKVYSSGEQLVHLSEAKLLQDGHTVQNEDLGEVDLRLSNKNVLEIRVNGLLCAPENPISINEDNLMGLSTLFRIIAVISSIGMAIQFYALLRIGLNVADIILVLFFSILCTIAYFLAAIFTKKGKVWAYFVGTGTFLLMTLIYTFNVLTSGLFESLVIVYSVFLLLRLSVVGILLYYLKSVIRIMNAPKNSENQDILDSF
ncbi:MAG: hypothetical protein P8P74_04740 [Crocinitomicaceae bacterium]|nr:hypothetical protein [Crocinitomicaceae bacterium]